MANASWLDPDGNVFLDSDERLMAPGSRRLLPCEVDVLPPWVRRFLSASTSTQESASHGEEDAEVTEIAGLMRGATQQAFMELLRREAAELVARNDAAMSPPVPLWMDAMRRAYAQRGPEDGAQ